MTQEQGRPSSSDGPNARPLHDGIAQSSNGLPDDSGRPVPISPDEERRMREKLTGGDGEAEVEAHPS